MSIYSQWKEIADRERNEVEHNKFWNDYLLQEKNTYEYILSHHDEVIEGTVGELAKKLDMKNTYFLGFLDGINESLLKELDLDSLEEDSHIKLDVDLTALFYNMLDAKANWLYTLQAWDNIFSKEKRDKMTKDYNRSKMAVSDKVGRNEPCPCGSGKKYKKCCGK
ncbi:SEC-C metal-binding domain-containing protein [Herbivorax sp. ANBcel31]|uniref:SEC-C metal-binding domain-containing protein n=1 Tax=Herbivorax sp. ANBcel31 TaxID=3069754 RepID=UPI0027B0EA50|nr:SEC-C metal-binding domain-containing protein [Herbivorax sp. ANBcel31]MDQ2086442.1 SEC-C metal-binding domain-containing protein [Herbivorax sp. ANBcel31]